MTLFSIACTKIADEHETFVDAQVTSRAPNGWTPPFPTRFEDWYYGPNQIRFCDGLGWNCWPSLDPDNPEPYWGLPGALAWPLTTQSDDSGPIVDLHWETDESLNMRILSGLHTYEEVLESTGGNEEAAQWAYNLMRERVNVPLPVVLDPRICEMLFDHYTGQRIKLLPGEYPINYNGENNGEVIIPVEIW